MKRKFWIIGSISLAIVIVATSFTVFFIRRPHERDFAVHIAVENPVVTQGESIRVTVTLKNVARRRVHFYPVPHILGWRIDGWTVSPRVLEEIAWPARVTRTYLERGEYMQRILYVPTYGVTGITTGYQDPGEYLFRGRANFRLNDRWAIGQPVRIFSDSIAITVLEK